MGNNQVTIKIADICIGINPVNNGWDVFCKDYIVDEEPDFIVESTEKDIAEEQKHIAEYTGRVKFIPLEVEKLWIQRQIAEKIPTYDAFFIHATSVRVDEDAYLFLGPSGAGKSTHSRLWKRHFGDRLKVINDDKPIIKVKEDEILACGSPWSGKEGLRNNISAPVRGCIYIHQAKRNSIESMSAKESWELIMRQAYRTQSAGNMKKTFKLFDKMIKTVPFYSLNCNKTYDAVELAYTKLQMK